MPANARFAILNPAKNDVSPSNETSIPQALVSPSTNVRPAAGERVRVP